MSYFNKYLFIFYEMMPYRNFLFQQFRFINHKQLCINLSFAKLTIFPLYFISVAKISQHFFTEFIYSHHQNKNNIEVLKIMEQSLSKLQKVSIKHHDRYKNNNVLSSLIKNDEQTECSKSRPQYLNSFVYHDHITNNAMAVRKDQVFDCNVKTRYSHKDALNQSCATIKQCFDLMKSTRKFHLRSIQAKNYKIMRPKQESKHSNSRFTTADQLNDFSKLAKQKLERYMKKKSSEKQNYNKDKSMLSKMLSTSFPVQQKADQSQLAHEQQQNNIDSKNELNATAQNGQNGLNDNRTRTFIVTSSKNLIKQTKLRKSHNFLQKVGCHTKSKKQSLHEQNSKIMEKQIMKEATAQLRYMVRKNGEFLVTPDINKRLGVDLRNKKRINEQKQNKYHHEHEFRASKLTQINFHEKQAKPQKSQYFQKSSLDFYTFNCQSERQIRQRMHLIDAPSLPNLQEQSTSNIIHLIEKGNYFRTQIELSVNPSLMMTKDKTNGNNLLHICIMNNKENIFQMILNKSQDHNIDLLGEVNKYGRTPTELGKVLGFFKSQSIRNMIGLIQKQKMKATFNMMAPFFSKIK